MEMNAANLFATLGHDGRLAVFRLLLRRAPHGVRPGEMTEALGLKPSTLSVYLAALETAGLVTAERQGRAILYRSDLPQTARLVAYLFNDCGRGRADLAPDTPTPEYAMPRPLNVLFVCSGNSARSIFAEALLRDLGQGRFVAHSAGTRPQSQLNPTALEVLARNGHDIGSLRAKSVAEYQTADSPVLDFVFTVCDAAANEGCAPWPGQPVTAHWGLPDPALATGTAAERALAFAQTYAALRRRIIAFTALPFAELEKVALQARVDTIGRTDT
ncbi:ArsR family transcriptional regulator [Paracoccaceae bacterium Fryx2]|nr:ArsR family transcriptional regulator [Paracoccaceae bacterium Fryx2]